MELESVRSSRRLEAARTIQRFYRRKYLKARIWERLSPHADSSLDSIFLDEILYFIYPMKVEDLNIFVGTCQRILEMNGDKLVKLFAGEGSVCSNDRVKKFALMSFHVIYHLRLLENDTINSQNVLLNTLTAILDSNLPWAFCTMSYLIKVNLFTIFRSVWWTPKEQITEPRWGIASTILNMIFSNSGLGERYFSQMALIAKRPNEKLEHCEGDVRSVKFSNLVENVLEAAGKIFSQPKSSYMTIQSAAAIETFALKLPAQIRLWGEKARFPSDSKWDFTDILNKKHGKLELQVYYGLSSNFLKNLTNALLGDYSVGNDTEEADISDAACAFLHIILNVLPVLDDCRKLVDWRGVVLVLWELVQYFEKVRKNIGSVTDLGHTLSLAAFCPIFKYMLTIVDFDDFYGEAGILPLEAVIPMLTNFGNRYFWINTCKEERREDLLRHLVCIRVLGLISLLVDWNCRQQIVDPNRFFQWKPSDEYISEARNQNSSASRTLQLAPFLIPFGIRAKVLSNRLFDSQDYFDPESNITVKRTHTLEDAFKYFTSCSLQQLRGVTRVSFENELGVVENGVDLKGIFRDFLDNVAQKPFWADYGLFKEGIDRLLFPNPESELFHGDTHLPYFYFLGRVLAKAMFENILIDVQFAPFFLNILKHKPNCLNDMPSYSQQIYKSLLEIKNSSESELRDLGLFFSLDIGECRERTEIDLVPGGEGVEVTGMNVLEYIRLVANYYLNLQIREQSSSFLSGFNQLIKKEWIDMFNQQELQLLISGIGSGIDIDDLQANTIYTGEYHPEHDTIKMFWEVMKTLSLQNQRKLLKFATGCSRGPLHGFENLDPRFTIRYSYVDNLASLPTASTCNHMLSLPPYTSQQVMEDKIIFAIRHGVRFELV